jgi:hypothetical protein
MPRKIHRTAVGQNKLWSMAAGYLMTDEMCIVWFRSYVVTGTFTFLVC